MREVAALLGALLAVGQATRPARPSPSPSPAAIKAGTCRLTINNKTSFRALVYVDGVYWGWVSPERAFTFSGLPKGDRLLYADTQYKEFFWGPEPTKCEGTATWDLRF